MEMKDIESGLIRRLGHDPVANVLRIEFKNGVTYDYQNFDSDHYGQLSQSDSKGKWYHANLRGNADHPYSKLDAETKE